jgi:hypothetical protein
VRDGGHVCERHFGGETDLLEIRGMNAQQEAVSVVMAAS